MMIQYVPSSFLEILVKTGLKGFYEVPNWRNLVLNLDNST